MFAPAGVILSNAAGGESHCRGIPRCIKDACTSSLVNLRIHKHDCAHMYHYGVYLCYVGPMLVHICIFVRGFIVIVVGLFIIL